MSLQDPIHVRQVNVREIYNLRHRVLRAGMPAESARFDGDEDPDAMHLAAYNGNAIVGCATLLLNSFEGERACQLRGMAVDPNQRRAGIGRTLLAQVDQIAREKKVNLLWANARLAAIDFYRELGWEIASKQFEIPTAGPHYMIIRRVAIN